jgi:DNA-directed RNA polymerase specialized sigma24 family protein
LDVMSQKIIFYRIEGYRNPEIASLLGISNSSVETKWWRLRKKLKKFL